MFPLGTVLLPGEGLPLHVFEPRYRALVLDCLAADDGPRFGVVLIARGHEVGGGDERHDLGVMARIVRHEMTPDGRFGLFCVGGERIRVVEWLADDPVPAERWWRSWPTSRSIRTRSLRRCRRSSTRCVSCTRC